MYKYVYLVLCWAKLSDCANILALVVAISYSHQVTFAPLWRELSLRGHNVTLLTTDPINDPTLTNLTEINIKWAYDSTSKGTYLIENKMSAWNYHQNVYAIMYHICDMVMASDAGQDLLSNKYQFDLVLVEYLSPELLAFAELYDCPKILIASMSVPSVYSDLIGDFTHPVLHPEFLTDLHGQLSFKERIVSTLTKWYVSYVLANDVFAQRLTLLQRYFNSTYTVPELLSDVDMMFLAVSPLIQGPRAIGPTTITFGGYKEYISKEQISPDIKKFLDNAKEGCVYVSLGTNVKSSELSQRTLNIIKRALGEIPYRVLWKFETDAADMPTNIKIVKWLPQQKILNHPNVKLFVCQGGLQSIEEAIHGEVPFVVIPFFADQYQNARILANKGTAIVLDRKRLIKDDLKNAMLKVINDPKYYQEVKRLKKLILDEPMTGLEKVVWWTEYVIRHKGAKHLRNPAADIAWYQYYLLDVIGFLLGITILFAAVSTLILLKIYNFIRNSYIEEKKIQ